jgi:TPR repeat protein
MRTRLSLWCRRVLFCAGVSVLSTTSAAAPKAQAISLRQDVAASRASGDWAPVLRDLQVQADQRGGPIYLTALAGLQFQGLGGGVDPARVLSLLSDAAEQGEPLAMTHLGVLHAQGIGVPRDLAKAAAWHRRAADLGVSEAQYNLGQLYHTVGIGDGKGPDAVQAAYWYRKAVDQGFPKASANLATLFLQGAGVEKNLDQAFALMRQAAEAGESAAQANLGMLYLNGVEGRPRDLGQAYYFLTLASSPDARGVCLPAALWVAVRKSEGFQGVSSDWVVRQELSRQTCMVPIQSAVGVLAKLDELSAKYPDMQAMRAQAQAARVAFMARRQHMDEPAAIPGMSMAPGRAEMGVLLAPPGWVLSTTKSEGEGVAVSEVRPTEPSGASWQEMATFKRFDRRRHPLPVDHLKPVLDGLAKACVKGWMTHEVFSGDERGFPTLVMVAYCDETPTHRSETHFVKVAQGNEALYEWQAIHRGDVGDAHLHSDHFKQLNVRFAEWLQKQVLCEVRAAAGSASACPEGMPASAVPSQRAM